MLATQRWIWLVFSSRLSGSTQGGGRGWSRAAGKPQAAFLRKGRAAGFGPRVHPSLGALLDSSLTMVFVQVPKHVLGDALFRVGWEPLLAVLIGPWIGTARLLAKASPVSEE